MLEKLKKEVFEANLSLVAHHLVIFTWGNASSIDREKGLVVIKPSGVAYDHMKVDDMVVVDLKGKVIEGSLKPSSDTLTHLEIYLKFSKIGGIAHTHSSYATSWAQAGIDIPIVGTTHADYFGDAIPCTRDMTPSEIQRGYEKETGRVIVERFSDIDPLEVPGVIVKNHGPFTWGENIEEAVSNSVVLEEVAKTTYAAKQLNPNLTMNDKLVEKHFKRKHGDQAYYGQTRQNAKGEESIK